MMVMGVEQLLACSVWLSRQSIKSILQPFTAQIEWERISAVAVSVAPAAEYVEY
jgi:hypothetical protein